MPAAGVLWGVMRGVGRNAAARSVPRAQDIIRRQNELNALGARLNLGAVARHGVDDFSQIVKGTHRFSKGRGGQPKPPSQPANPAAAQHRLNELGARLNLGAVRQMGIDRFSRLIGQPKPAKAPKGVKSSQHTRTRDPWRERSTYDELDDMGRAIARSMGDDLIGTNAVAPARSMTRTESLLSSIRSKADDVQYWIRQAKNQPYVRATLDKYDEVVKGIKFYYGRPFSRGFSQEAQVGLLKGVIRGNRIRFIAASDWLESKVHRGNKADDYIEYRDPGASGGEQEIISQREDGSVEIISALGRRIVRLVDGNRTTTYEGKDNIVQEYDHFIDPREVAENAAAEAEVQEKINEVLKDPSFTPMQLAPIRGTMQTPVEQVFNTEDLVNPFSTDREPVIRKVGQRTAEDIFGPNPFITTVGRKALDNKC